MINFNDLPAKDKIYYQDSDVVIYCADCRDILPLFPDKVFDLVLTDPPYGLNEIKNNKSRGKLAISKDYGEGEWDIKPLDTETLKLILSKGELQVIFGGNYFELPPSKCWFIWDKVNYGNDFADCEMAWTNLNMAVRLFRFQWNGMLQGDMKNKEVRVHPTQKPLSLMKWCIEKSGQLTETVLDPFLGSGTTLVAAKILGRKAIGIEISEAYCKIAAQRLSQSVMPLNCEQVKQGQKEEVKQENLL